MSGGEVVTRVLDDAFADREGEVEAAPGRIALFKPGDDAEGVQVVVKAEAVLPQRGIECFLARVAEGGMTDVVGEGKGLGEFAVQSQSRCEGAGDLGYFKRVRQPGAEMVCGKIVGKTREDLGLSGQPPECAGVKNAGGVAREGRPIRVRRLWMNSSSEIAAFFNCNVGRQ